MEKLDFLNKIIDIKDVALATINKEGKPTNRIIDMMYLEDDCLYFLTARGKNFYQEIMDNPFISLTVCKNNEAYSLSGHVIIVDRRYLKILFDRNRFMYGTYPGDTKNVLEVFKIDSWIGEYFSLKTKPITRLSFSHNIELKTNIYQVDKSKCISCGKCLIVCPQKCIDIKNKIIIEKNCLKCGACFEVCPNKAISR